MEDCQDYLIQFEGPFKLKGLTVDDVRTMWELKDRQDLTSTFFNELFTEVLMKYLLDDNNNIIPRRFNYVIKRIEKDTVVYDSGYTILLNKLKNYDLPSNLDNLFKRFGITK
jgi:hypothetical protein